MLTTKEIFEDKARAQIQRIIESELFRASGVQRRLFKYLAEKSLAGEAGELKEYVVGVDALGKPESYDPQQDSTVRIQSSRLRQKLIEYYQTLGQADPVLIDFPRGHFKLLITPRESPPVQAFEQTAAKWRRIALAAIGACVIAVGLGLYWRVSLVRLERSTTTSTEAWQPALEEFWQTYLTSKTPTLICLGTPLFIRIPTLGFVREPGAMRDWPDAVRTGVVKRLEQRFPGEHAEPWYAFTGIGESGGTFLLGKLLGTRIPDLQFATSTALTWNEIGANNLIFVGPPKFNEQIKDLPIEQDLVMESDKVEGVRNLRPRPGEPAFFGNGVMDAQNQTGETYALISRLPGLHGRKEIMVLAGAWMPGTLAACQYVTMEGHAKELLSKIRLPSGKLPPYYQVLIRCKFERWTPVQISYVLHHVLFPAGQRMAPVPANPVP
jgi:hypothetical protein